MSYVIFGKVRIVDGIRKTEKFLSYLIPDRLTLDDVITKATYQVFEEVYKNSSKENFKKVERVLKKIDKVCREYD